ncbi:hypothetical protein VT06_13065 [Arsukibacterium sp. MJ3]|uniref:hypothetical protein n=1 Tax=Arsukibacterium sp. MJ3 TaxID=1632859 RepID=UPI0006273970|nr:hypothetical protein [Arsukibacterium sp. MJ3]KKO48168.1 hypothetical protein VT06_13065 [Arsukibacterium sp. MJ3]
MSLTAELSANVAQIQQQFLELLEQELTDADAAISLINQFEQALLALSQQTVPTVKLTLYLQDNLSWLALQVEKLSAERTGVAEQLIQITRARKGNASYDNTKQF